MRVLWVLGLFLFLGALLIISNHNLALYKFENFVDFGKLYLGWFNQIYENVQTMTGNAVELEWVPS